MFCLNSTSELVAAHEESDNRSFELGAVSVGRQCIEAACWGFWILDPTLQKAQPDHWELAHAARSEWLIRVKAATGRQWPKAINADDQTLIENLTTLEDGRLRLLDGKLVAGGTKTETLITSARTTKVVNQVAGHLWPEEDSSINFYAALSNLIHPELSTIHSYLHHPERDNAQLTLHFSALLTSSLLQAYASSYGQPAPLDEINESIEGALNSVRTYN